MKLQVEKYWKSKSFNDFSINEALHLVCEGCDQTLKIGEGSLIMINLEEEDENLEHVLNAEIQRNILETNICCGDENKKYVVQANQMFLFVMLTESKKLQIPDKCYLQNEEFLYLSHVQEIKVKNEIKYRTNFLYNDLILYQTECDIVLSNAEELKNNVKLFSSG